MKAALQIYSRDFDADFFKLPFEIQRRIEDRVDRLGNQCRVTTVGFSPTSELCWARCVCWLLNPGWAASGSFGIQLSGACAHSGWHLRLKWT